METGRKKETGSTVAARVAGTTLATALTAKSTKTTGTSVMGETASNENPRSTFEISTISGTSRTVPIASPSTVILSPCNAIMPTTVRTSAPSVMRTPIS